MTNQQETSQTRLNDIRNCKTLPEILSTRAGLNPEAVALRQYDRTAGQWTEVSYAQLLTSVQTWQKALCALDLTRGARVAILLNNSVSAVLADESVLANALIPVPLHAIDTPGASAYVISDSGASVLITNKLERWKLIEGSGQEMTALRHVVLTDGVTPEVQAEKGPRIWGLEDWLASGRSAYDIPDGPRSDELAAIVYTSGTTGRPKGVMLTHENIVSNIIATLIHIAPLPTPTSMFLSFLPLSHTFERTAGYYLPLAMGCTISFNRSIALLNEDLRIVRPDVLISVPRIYERIYARINDKLSRAPAFSRFMFNACVEVGWRRFCRANKIKTAPALMSWADGLVWPILKKLVADKAKQQFGGRLKLPIAGGAALNGKVARMFCGLGLEPIQGYGMTEASPIIAGNSLKINHPDTVGVAFPGMQIRLAPDTREIQVKGPSVMRGYWNRPEDTAKILSEDGWLSTGDVGEYDEEGLLRIRGRIKEIIVTSTGEKVPPVDLELALETDPLFAQALVLGENRPFISLIACLNPEEWAKLAMTLEVDAEDPKSLTLSAVRAAVLKRAKAAVAEFPHYAMPRALTLTLEPWTVENGLLTPTLKLKRAPLMKKFETEVEAMYAGHNKL